MYASPIASICQVYFWANFDYKICVHIPFVHISGTTHSCHALLNKSNHNNLISRREQLEHALTLERFVKAEIGEENNITFLTAFHHGWEKSVYDIAIHFAFVGCGFQGHYTFNCFLYVSERHGSIYYCKIPPKLFTNKPPTADRTLGCGNCETTFATPVFYMHIHRCNQP